MISCRTKEKVKDWAERTDSYLEDGDFEDKEEALDYAAQDCLGELGLVDATTYEKDKEDVLKILLEEWDDYPEE